MEFILFLGGVGIIVYILVTRGSAGSRLDELEARVRALESKEKGGIPRGQAAPAAPQSFTQPTPQAASAPMREVNYTFDAPAPQAPMAAPSRPSEPASFEEMVGGGLLTKIGITALLFGVGFFLKYAFDNEWIGPTGQVIMGVMGGLFLIILGDFLREKYRAYALSLVGGGIGILYLSIYAAHGFYHLIASVPLASVLFSGITFCGVILAVRHDSLPLAGIAVFGGFLTPFLVSTGENKIFSLFTYVTVLDLGILAVSIMKRWRPLNMLGMAGTVLTFMAWAGTFYTRDQLFITEFFLTVFFLIFSLSLIVYLMFRDEELSGADILMTAVVPFAYFTVSYGLLNPEYGSYMGFFAALLAVWYVFLGYIGYEVHKSDAHLVNTLLGTALVFLTIAIPLQLDGVWTTLAWGVEALFLTWMGFLAGSRYVRLFGFGVLVIALVRLFAFESGTGNILDYTIFLNIRFFLYLALAFVALGMAVLYKHYEEAVSGEDVAALPALFLIFNFLLIFILSAEVVAYYSKESAVLAQNLSKLQQQTVDANKLARARAEYSAGITSINNTRNVSLSLLWIVYSVVLLGIGIISRYKPLRLMAIVLFGFTIFKVFIYDSSALEGLYRIISFMVLGVILVVTGYLYQRYRERISEFMLGDAQSS